LTTQIYQIKIIHMIKVSISEAKVQLLELIDKVLKGEEVIITISGKPVVKIVEYKEKSAKI